VPDGLEAAFEILPECRAACFDLWANATHNSLIADAVFSPTLTLVRQVQQNGHGPIDSMCKMRIGCIGAFEFLPQRQECASLALRQHCENACYRGKFGC